MDKLEIGIFTALFEIPFDELRAGFILRYEI